MESTKLQLFIATIGVIVAIISVYLNYRKKSAITQSANNSSGVIQQKDVIIEKQTINLNSGNVVSSPTINLINCTLYIQTMNPNDLSNESIVKNISDCIIKNAPEFTGTILKDKEFELNDNKLKLINAISDKVEQYSKAGGKILKDSKILRAIGIEAYYMEKLEDSFKHFSEALSVDEELKDRSGKATDLNNIGMVYKNWGKPEKALEYFQKALEINEELKDIRGKATRLNNIGSVYQGWRRPEKALEYIQKALEINEELKDIRGKATDLNNIGMVYEDWRKPEKALEYYQKALKLFEDLKDERSSAIVKGNINVLGTQEV